MIRNKPHNCNPFWPGFIPCLAMLVLFTFSGCERVIEVDLNEVNPQIVIEGNLSFISAGLDVKISKTGNYFGTEAIEPVDNARVYLETHDGKMVEAVSNGSGRYSLKNEPLELSREYRLHVEYDGKKYEAASTLLPPVPIDSLDYEYLPEETFSEGGYRLLLIFADPVDEENFYRVKVFRNGELLNSLDDLIVFDDSGLNGKEIEVTLRRQLFEYGDSAFVQFQTIDESTFLYFNSLREMAGLNPGSPAPSNPVSNFSNGALGYFSAWSADVKELVIE